MSEGDEPTVFSRRRLLGGLTAMGAAGALGGATTSLLWDEEKFGTANNPNVFQAGALDLKVDWEEHYYNGIDDDGDGSVDEADEVIQEESGLTDQPGPVVTLEDVKPGDRGEVTFSLHVFDNPGWVSMCGELHADEDNGLTEPEDKVDGHTPNDSDGTAGGDLADHVRARAWYDHDGDNELDVGDTPADSEPIFAEGTLREVLTELEQCLLLDPTSYPQHTSPDVTPGGGPGVQQIGEDACVELEKLEWNDETGRLEPEVDDDDGVSATVPDGDYVTVDDDVGTYRFSIEENGSDVFVVEVTITATVREESGQPREFDFEVTDSADGIGICQVFVKGGPDFEGNAYEYSDCVEADECLSPPMNPNSGNPYGVSNVRFFACNTGDDDNGDISPQEINGDCFPNSTTYHVGFEWFLPRDIPGVNDNIVQTDRAEFQVSFEAVQCRHNVTEDGEPIQTLPDADDENNARHHN